MKSFIVPKRVDYSRGTMFELT